MHRSDWSTCFLLTQPKHSRLLLHILAVSDQFMRVVGGCRCSSCLWMVSWFVMWEVKLLVHSTRNISAQDTCSERHTAFSCIYYSIDIAILALQLTQLACGWLQDGRLPTCGWHRDWRPPSFSDKVRYQINILWLWVKYSCFTNKIQVCLGSWNLTPKKVCLPFGKLTLFGACMWCHPIITHPACVTWRV
jgi:hypothetical protein